MDHVLKIGAGEGNRTLVTGLEGQGFTTKLHPHMKIKHLQKLNWSRRRDLNPRPSPWQGDALPLSHFCKYGGGGRIRTFEVTDSGFTVRPLWPLGNPTRYGANNGTRTRNLLITSQLLYQLSYVGVFYPSIMFLKHY